MTDRPEDIPVPPLDSETLDAMFAAVAAETVDRPATGLARLRELPTWRRVTLATIGALALALGWWLVARAMMATGVEVSTRELVTIGLTPLVLVAALEVSLRGLARPARAGLAWFVVALGLAGPALVALTLPTALTSGTAGILTVCVVFGLTLGAAVAALVWTLDRGGLSGPRRAAAAAAAGGVTAYATLELACAGTGLAHVLVDHALVGLTLAALAAVTLARRRGRDRAA